MCLSKSFSVSKLTPMSSKEGGGYPDRLLGGKVEVRDASSGRMSGAE